MIDLTFAKALSKEREEKDVLLFLAELMKTSREGNLYLSHPTIHEKISHLTDGEKSPLVAFEDCFYLRRSWELEGAVIANLKRLMGAPSSFPSSARSHDLYPAQQKALEMTLAKPLALITGGPGCGKTYLAMSIVKTFLALKPGARVIATAPTGKAASRLKMDGVVSGTLHSLLGLKDSFDETKKIKPLIADLILIDECSMIDLRLFASLLMMIPTGTHLVLMGDPDQLPPVDAGALFHDMCKIEEIPHVHLDQIKRTDSEKLQKLSECIKEGKVEEALEHVALLPLREIPETKDVILTPFRHGPFGTHACNKTIEERGGHEKKPIIITKNDHQLGLMNGDLGYIVGDRACFGERNFPLSLLSAHEHAFAISIHKSQGSEFPSVTILLPEGSEIFGREMLYTAITRAKSEVTVYGSPSTFRAIISHISYPKTNLRKRWFSSTSCS